MGPCRRSGRGSRPPRGPAGQVQRRRRLRDAALLVGEGDDSCAFCAGSGGRSRDLLARGASSCGGASCSPSWGRVKRPANRITRRPSPWDRTVLHALSVPENPDRIVPGDQFFAAQRARSTASSRPLRPARSGSARVPRPLRPVRAPFGARSPPPEPARSSSSSSLAAPAPARALRSELAAPEPVLPPPWRRRYPAERHVSVTERPRSRRLPTPAPAFRSASAGARAAIRRARRPASPGRRPRARCRGAANEVAGRRRRVASASSRRRSSTSTRSRGVSPSSGGARRRRKQAFTGPERRCERASQLLGREGSAWKSESSQRSRASPRSRSSSARVSRSRSLLARSAVTMSMRTGSPGGTVAAIGRTGRMPYGRQSSRSKSTGPAAIGPAVASRSGDCVGELAGSVRRRDVVAAKLLQLEDAQPVGLALEPVRKQSPSPWPVRRQLARRHMANAARPQVEPSARRESDDRSDRAVRTLRAEERLLEAGIGALERLVAPVEAAASLRRLLQQREQHRPQQRAPRARPTVGVRLREDRGSRLSFELRQAVCASRSAASRPARASRKGPTSGRYS